MSDFFNVNGISVGLSNQVVRGKIIQSLTDGLDWPEPAKEKLILSSTDILQKGMTACSENGRTTGLVVGYVQSGKTMSFSTVLALAADNGFQLAIVFAGITNQLLQQTRDRLTRELVGEENWWHVNVKTDHTKFAVSKSSEDSQLAVVPVLKSAQRINELCNAIQELGDDIRTPVLIIDDEADQASFNTLASKNSREGTDEKSATFAAISLLRDTLDARGSHIYLQYTATPQAPLLINMTELLSPDWHVVLDPGLGYFGGRQLFEGRLNQVEVIPPSETYHTTDNPLEHRPDSLVSAIWEFIIAATIHFRFRGNKKGITMMIHPDRVKEDHRKFYDWTRGLCDVWKNELAREDRSDELISLVESVYRRYSRQIIDCPPLEALWSEIPKVMGRVRVMLMNSDRQEEIDWRQSRCAILVGGDLLNRGFTVEGLVVTYMPRYSKGKSNADTLQQRARFFGYKSGVEDLVRVHLPESTIHQYATYVQDEEVIRQILRDSKTTQELRQTIVQDPVMRPTRANILSRRIIQSELNGAKPFNTHHFDYIDRNTELLFNLVEGHKKKFELFREFGSESRNHATCRIPITELIALLLELRFSNAREVGLKTAAIQFLIHHMNRSQDDGRVDDCRLVFMAHGHIRERQMSEKGRALTIQQLFSGRAPKGEYPGDSKIFDPTTVTLQVHCVRPKGGRENEVFYVPALVFPEDLCVHFATTSDSENS